MSGGNFSRAISKDTLADLVAIPVPEDGQFYFVKTPSSYPFAGSLYRFELGASYTARSPGIVADTTATGYWVMVPTPIVLSASDASGAADIAGTIWINQTTGDRFVANPDLSWSAIASGSSSATTLTTTGFTQPAYNANVTLNVASSAIFSPDQYVFVADTGTYLVISAPGPTQLQVENLPGNIAPGSSVTTGKLVTPTGRPADGSAWGDLTGIPVTIDSISGLDFTGNAAKIIAVNGTEDGFELVIDSGGGGGSTDAPLNEFRLAPATGAYYPATDYTAVTTLYLTPRNTDGNGRITLFDGSGVPFIMTATEKSLSLSGLTVNTNYAIYAYSSDGTSSGTLTLEAEIWSNSGAGTSTRTTAIAYHLGIPHKAGAYDRRHVGDIRIGSVTGETKFVFGGEDTPSEFLISNVDNLLPFQTAITDVTGHTYSTVAYRYWLASSNYYANFICSDVSQVNIYTSSAVAGASAITEFGILKDGTLDLVGTNALPNASVNAGLSCPDIVSSGYHYYGHGEFGYGGGTRSGLVLRLTINL